MTIDVDLWTDPLCIWALAAERRVDALHDEFGDRVRFRHRILPVFGSIDWRFDAGPWAKGGVEARVEATARVAREQGIEGVSGAVWRQRPPSSWGPSAVAEAVRQLELAGDVPEGSTDAALRGLRHRFFLDDVDVTRRDAQRAILEQLRLPADRVFALVDDGHALARLAEAVKDREDLKIEGSPTWILDGGHAKLYGNVTERVLHDTVAALLAGEELGRSVC